jgi:hypothetical protein
MEAAGSCETVPVYRITSPHITEDHIPRHKEVWNIYYKSLEINTYYHVRSIRKCANLYITLLFLAFFQLANAHVFKQHLLVVAW